MKALVIRSVVVLAIVSGFTVSAEAQTVTPNVGITVASSKASFGVLAGS